MAPRTVRMVIAVLGLIAWLPFVLALYPFPHQTATEIEHQMRQTEKELGPLAQRVSPKPIEKQIDEVKTERWLLWSVNLSLLALGLVASVLSLRGVGVWRGLMFTLSVLFLALYLVDFLIGPYGSFSETIIWKLKMVQGFKEQGIFSSYVFFGLKELVLPIVHLIIVSLVVYHWSQVSTEKVGLR